VCVCVFMSCVCGIFDDEEQDEKISFDFLGWCVCVCVCVCLCVWEADGGLLWKAVCLYS
jgi:hypothetical protein